MSARPKPRCDDVFAWLRLRLGQTALAPLTGTTGRALRAYVHLLDAWCSSRSESVEAALRATLAILQPSEWELAAWAIVAVGDWGFVADLWPRIKPPGAPNWIADGSIPPHEGGEHWGALIEIAGRRWRRAGNGTRYHLIDGAGDPLCGRDGLSPAGADWVSTHEKDIPPIYMRCEACNLGALLDDVGEALELVDGRRCSDE